jgi:hypothetical protein
MDATRALEYLTNSSSLVTGRQPKGLAASETVDQSQRNGIAWNTRHNHPMLMDFRKRRS